MYGLLDQGNLHSKKGGVATRDARKHELVLTQGSIDRDTVYWRHYAAAAVAGGGRSDRCWRRRTLSSQASMARRSTCGGSEHVCIGRVRVWVRVRVTVRVRLRLRLRLRVRVRVRVSSPSAPLAARRPSPRRE